MSPGGSERTRSERYDDILSAAERVFTRDGFAAATMDAIAVEACVSKGGLYRHVAGKDELFLTILARLASELEALLKQACEPSPRSGYSALESCVGAAVAFARARDGRFRLALDSSAIRDLVEPQNTALPAFDAAIERLVQFALEVLRRGQRDGTIRSDIHVHALAVSLWGSVIGTLQIERNLKTIAFRVGARDGAARIDFVTVITSSARPSSPDGASYVEEQDLGNGSGED